MSSLASPSDDFDVRRFAQARRTTYQLREKPVPQDESEKVVGEYKHRYVAFLDLLGFKAQVECAEHSPAERQPNCTTSCYWFGIQLVAIPT